LEGLKQSPASQHPQAVLFACGLNSVRSPMAAALLKQMAGRSLYVRSAGVRKAELDPFAAAAMEEIGIDIKAHRPITFEELEDLEGLNFDLIVTLSPEAHHKALELTRTSAVDVEYWPTADPTAIEGSREQRLDAYREVRDQLLARIRARFVRQRSSNE
jgi:protein-tyrosine-phosphatase